MTTTQVGFLLGVSDTAIRKWVAKGLLHPRTTPGGHRRFSPKEVEAFQAAMVAGKFQGTLGINSSRAEGSALPTPSGITKRGRVPPLAAKKKSQKEKHPGIKPGKSVFK
jgi:excisionase family DNA binding protein